MDIDSDVEGGEVKFHDFTLTNPIVAATGEVFPSLNLIAQGATESTRIGRKCTIRSIHWRYQVSLPVQDAVAQPASADSVRIILYQDRQCNGAAAAKTDILETANFQSFTNLTESGRFILWIDKTISMNYAGMASDGAGVVSQATKFADFAYNKSCEIPLEFDAGEGVIGEIRSNNLGVLQISKLGIAGFTSKIRLRFTDE